MLTLDEERIRQQANKQPGLFGEEARWRRPLMGYLASIILVGSSLYIGLIESQVFPFFAFSGMLLVFVIVFVALLWGIGPSIFATFLSLLVLNYSHRSPFDMLHVSGWGDAIQLMTFATASILIVLLINQLERARRRAYKAQQEATLRAHQLEATFEAMNDGLIVCDNAGNIVQMNTAAQRIFGLHPQPASEESQPQQELLLQAMQRDEHGQILPERRRPLSRLFQGEVLTGKHTADVLVQTPDGHEMILNMSGAPIRNDRDNIESVELIFRDITERHHLEKRNADALQALLAMAEAQVQKPEYVSLVEDSPIPRIMERIGQHLVDLTHSIVPCKHVMLLSMDEEETLYPIASTGFTPSEQLQWNEMLTEVPTLSGHLGEASEFAMLAKDQIIVLDGITLPLYTHVLPYYAEPVVVAPISTGNRLVGILCVDNGSLEHTYTQHQIALMQTIARMAALMLERERLQREYAEAQASELAQREANRRMEEFIGIICHELKNPLTVISVNLQLMERKIKRLQYSDSPIGEEIQQITSILALLERAQRQQRIQDCIISDLLDISRVQSNAFNMLTKPCNLVDIVQEGVEDQRQIVSARTIALELPDNKTVQVQADSERIRQVVTNYLTNALKYSEPDRAVQVSLSIEDHTAYVTVHDEGPGLSAVEQESIWQRFYRVPGIETQSDAGVSNIGLGVGLYLCRTIIELHNGKVGVQSQVGKGSTFWFSLPLAEQE